jgi:integrase/recombinase XerD
MCQPAVFEVSYERRMALLDAGIDSMVNFLWLGHGSTKSTQPYLHAHLAIKEAALAKMEPSMIVHQVGSGPGDDLPSFLEKL